MSVPTTVDLDTVSHLRAVLGRLARRLRGTAAGAGLTPTQLSVLGTLTRHDADLRLSDLADLEGINPTMLSRVIGSLDGLGLVQRGADPADRRAAQVRITDAGRGVHGQVQAERTRALLRTLRILPTEQVRALLDALPALDALAEALRDERVRRD